MIVAFLDLLGFSALLETDVEVALDNMNSFNNALRTKVIDNKNHPISEYDSEIQAFAEKSSVTSFEQMISFSDSLILGGSNVDLFVSQLANFVASAYITYAKPFREKFADIKQVTTDQIVTATGNGSFRKHRAFPVLFRGGISSGDNVGFFDEYHIKDSSMEFKSRNVTGLTYLNAVRLEHSGKGPRLFCDQSVVDTLSSKKMIKEVDKERGIFEIVWSIEGCETLVCSSNKWDNVIRSITETMLPPAVNLYLYYRMNNSLKEQYGELLKLVCCGIVKYAENECSRGKDAMTLINKKLEEIPLLDSSVFNGFLE